MSIGDSYTPTYSWSVLLLVVVLIGFLLAGFAQVLANTAPDALDQGAYLSMALAAKEELRLSDPYRQPLLSWLLAPFAHRQIEFFTLAKLFCLMTGALAVLSCYLVSIWLYRKPWLAVLSAFLLASNLSFLQESATVMVEPLLASLMLLTWFLGLKALTRSRYRDWALGGVLSGLVYLAKESGLFWGAAWVIGAFITNRFHWKRYGNFVLFLLMVIVTLTPFWVFNMAHYGQPVLTDSTSVVWLDDWEEFFEVSSDAPGSLQEYLERHTWRDLLYRLGDGLLLTIGLGISVFAPFQLDQRMRYWFNKLLGDRWGTYSLLIVGILVTLVLVHLCRRKLIAYCRTKGRLVAYTGSFLLIYVLGTSWLVPVTFDPRYIVPLLPMGYVMFSGLMFYVSQDISRNKPRFFHKFKRASIATLVVAILIWGFIALKFTDKHHDGASVAYTTQTINLADPFETDRQTNRVELSVLRALEDISPQTVVYQPSHDLPIWIIEGKALVLFVPSDVNWPQFAAYLREQRAEYLVMTPELYLRRQNLFRHLFYPAWPTAEGKAVGRRYIDIRVLPAAWELVHAEQGFPSPYYIFRLASDTDRDRGTHIERGDTAIVEGDWDQAEEEYQVALLELQNSNTARRQDADPACDATCRQHQAQIYRTLSQIATLRERPDDALHYIEQALILQPDSAWYHTIRGDVLNFAGQQRSASKEYQSALDLVGDKWANLPASLAWTQEEQGQLEQAIKGYEAAAEISADFPWYNALLGRSLMAHERSEEAIALFQDILNQKIDWPFVNDWLVEAYSVGQAPTPAAPLATNALEISYSDGLLLKDYQIDQKDYLRDGQLQVILHWAPPAYAGREYRVYGKLINAVYTVWGEGEASLQRRGIPQGAWTERAELQDTLIVQVKPGTPSGDYELTIDIRDMIEPRWLDETQPAEVKLGPVQLLPRVLSVEQLDMTQAYDAVFGEQIRFLGYRTDGAARPGDTVHLTLFWQALRKMDADYTVFTHLLDSENNLRGQKDNQPADGFYPTSRWQPGEIVRDPYPLPIAAGSAPGEYIIQVGVYHAATGQRLPVDDNRGSRSGDSVDIILTLSP